MSQQGWELSTSCMSPVLCFVLRSDTPSVPTLSQTSVVIQRFCLLLAMCVQLWGMPWQAGRILTHSKQGFLISCSYCSCFKITVLSTDPPCSPSLYLPTSRWEGVPGSWADIRLFLLQCRLGEISEMAREDTSKAVCVCTDRKSSLGDTRK